MTSPLMNNVLILKGPDGLRVKLDQGEVDLQRNVSGLPATVHRNEAKATYWDARMSYRLLDPLDRPYQLTVEQLNFLERILDDLNVFLYHADPACRAQAATNLKEMKP